MRLCFEPSARWRFLSRFTRWDWADGLSYLPVKISLVEHVYQIVAFPVAAAAVWFGIQRHYRELVNLGSAFFAIFLLTRFVDWWWDWMPKYVFFFVVWAIALALLAAFRKMRGRMGAPA